ncbi:MAG: EAL domain-containing protein, partial [Frankiales bacterium]|nr:EAL domain-containing protein [Frankiales bacterium]
MTLNELSPDGLAALGLRNACDREPIHLSGAVQPHGVLLVVDRALVVTAASLNAAMLGGLGTGSGLAGVLGATLDEVLGIDAAGAVLANHATGNPHDNLAAHVELATQDAAGGRSGTTAYDVVTHRRGPLLLVELEESGAEDAQGTPQLFRRQRESVKKLNQLDDVEDICRLAAADVRELTGYDRVMVYRFEPDAHGHVIAEARNQDAEAFLGLHYPAGDIPRQARALYLNNWIRIIEDVDYEPVPIMAQAGAALVDRLDLSMSVLRSVSPVHLQYLRNMGVAATMTISLIVDNQLWGLIACHHNSPKKVGHTQRLMCEALGQQVSVRLKVAESTKDHEHVRDLGRMAAQVVTAMAASENPAAGAAAAEHAVLGMAAADGAVVEIDGLRITLGSVPDAHMIDVLVSHLAGLAAGSLPLAADELPRIPGLATDQERQGAGAATGTLFLPLPGRVQGFVLWMRGELAQTVRWAGRPEPTDPQDGAGAVGGGQHALTPRSSFEEWREQVSGRSRPWRARELAAATELAQAMPEVLMHRAQNRLVRLALHDPLTGLPNRTLLQDRLRDELRPLPSPDLGGEPPVAVLFLDLDGFKAVNDTQGHAVGDELLTQVARRLVGVTRPQDTVARLGGDEFVVLLPHTAGPEAATVAQHVVEEFRRSFTLDGRVWRSLTCSVGVAAAAPGTEPGEVLRQADAALYHAKRNGRNQVAIYDPASGTAASRNQLASEELRDAISTGQIVVHYQPVLDLTASDAPVLDGFEALARWQHPTRGLLAPEQFIGLAEQTGLIDALGNSVLRQSLQQLQAWPDRRLTLAVNVSVQQLVQPNFAQHVLNQLVELGIAPHRLCLEVTESQMMEQPQLALAALSELDAADVRIAIDDFGTGFSSLAYARDMPAALLKIDRPFIAGLPANCKDGAVVGATAQLAHNLGLRTVAEGVETGEQLACLRAMG